MHAAQQKPESNNIFLRMHPVHRILLSLAFVLLAFAAIRKCNLQAAFVITVLWDVFAFTYVVISWIVFFLRPKEQIIKLANKDDGSKMFVLISILLTSFASMFAVLLLMLSSDNFQGRHLVTLPVVISGMMLSWVMVHTLFTFHYAHMYYSDYENKRNKNPDLEFPGHEDPDYLDFAYFSFVIGMTFQVSDVEIASPRIRRTALAHGLLAFALNTFVIALTINLIAGLKK